MAGWLPGWLRRRRLRNGNDSHDDDNENRKEGGHEALDVLANGARCSKDSWASRTETPTGGCFTRIANYYPNDRTLISINK